MDDENLIGSISLKSVDLEKADKTFALRIRPERAPVVCYFGSDPSCDFRVNRSYVRPKHCSLEWRPDDSGREVMWVVDLTKVIENNECKAPYEMLRINSEPLIGKEQPLGPQDSISISGRTFKLNVWGKNTAAREQFIRLLQSQHSQRQKLQQSQQLSQQENTPPNNNISIPSSNPQVPIDSSNLLKEREILLRRIETLEREKREKEREIMDLKHTMSEMVKVEEVDKILREKSDLEEESDRWREQWKVEREQRGILEDKLKRAEELLEKSRMDHTLEKKLVKPETKPKEKKLKEEKKVKDDKKVKEEKKAAKAALIQNHISSVSFATPAKVKASQLVEELKTPVKATPIRKPKKVATSAKKTPGKKKVQPIPESPTEHSDTSLPEGSQSEDIGNQEKTPRMKSGVRALVPEQECHRKYKFEVLPEGAKRKQQASE